MRRFKNLLLLDPGPDGRVVALERAVALARANDARLTVAGAAAEVPDDLAEIVRRRKTLDLGEAARAEERELLESWIGSLPPGAPPIDIEVLPRDSFVEVLTLVERGGHDLLMLAAEDDVGGWFGTTATHLLRKSAVPVWVMKHHPVPRYRRILVAVDRNLQDPAGDVLNEKLLQLGNSLAEAEGSELHVAHAWTIIAEWILKNRLSATSEEMAAITAEALASREAWLGQLLSSTHGIGDPARLHLVKGEAHEAIPDLTRELEVDLIVMGTLGRSGVFGALIGNTAERILNRVRCAVLAVKPDGFRCPVRVPAD